MSKLFFECKVKYRKTDENGMQKVVAESYLVDAISFTEAESIINEKGTLISISGIDYYNENYGSTNK